MIADFVVEEDFITEQERLTIKQLVLILKPCWTDHRPERYSNVDFSTLGNALYIMEGTDAIAADIDQRVRDLLVENFSWLYLRLCDKIQSLTGKPTQLHPDLTVPGFHIGHRSGDTVDDAIGFYHQDMSILHYDPEANMETNRSVLVAIDIPVAGAYLLYLQDNQQQRLPYKLGAFYQWDARLQHKVGGLRVMPGEYRITLQCHYYYNARKQCNLVYF